MSSIGRRDVGNVVDGRHLPGLHLHAPFHHSNPQTSQDIVRRGGVVVYAPIEGGRHVLANARADECDTAGVLCLKLANVMHNAPHHHQRPFLGHPREFVKGPAGKLGDWDAPVKPVAPCVEPACRHLQPRLLDRVVGEGFQVRG